MQVQVHVAIELAAEPQGLRTPANVAERGLRRLLHHVAQLAGDGELALAVEYLHFRGEDAAAHLGPGKARDQADFALFMHFGVTEFGHAEELADVRGRELFLVLEAALDDLAGHLAADVADLALQVADSGLARVVANDFENSVVGEDDVLVAQAGLLALLFHQVLARDFELFLLGVALQTKNLHAVLQSGRDGVHDVGRGHKQHLREVVVYVQVVILEGGVLLRVQHFQ